MKLTLENLSMYCTEIGQCMLWNLGCSGAGYPIARLDGRSQHVRRYVFRLTGKELKRGYVVVSRCNDSRCVSPACLRSRSRGQMISDTYARGSRSGEYHSRLNKIIRQGVTKLDMDKARQIRARAGEKKSALGREFGVHRSCITAVLEHRTWREASAIDPRAHVFREAA
jgi:hypothetical protein